MGVGDGIRQYLPGAGVVFKRPDGIGATGAGTPETIAAVANQRGDLVAVEIIGVGGGGLQISEDAVGNAGDAVNVDVG